MTCPICGGAGWLRHDVEWKHPDFGKAFPCECKTRETLRGMKQQLSEPNWNLDNFFGDENALAQARQACALGHGLWVFWSRAFGTGKTGLLIAIVNDCLHRNIKAIYQTVPRLLDELRAGYASETYDDLMQSFMDTPVLALDEFHRYFDKYSKAGNAEGSSSWAAEKMFQIVDARYRNYATRLTLIATNREPDKGGLDPLESRFGDTLRSHIVAVGGGDMRPYAAQLELA